MTRPDPQALDRAVTAAYRFDRSVRENAEHLSAVLHDIEPSLRPDQLRAVVAAVRGDLGTTVTSRAGEPDTTIAAGFAATHPDFDATIGVDLVRVFRQRTGTSPSPAAPAAPTSPGRQAPAPTTAPPAAIDPSQAPTAAPPAPGHPSPGHPSQAPTTAPPSGIPDVAGAPTQRHQVPGQPYGSTQPAPPELPPPPGRSRRRLWVALVAVVVVVAAVAVALALQGDDPKGPNRAGGPTGANTAGTTSGSSSKAGAGTADAVPPAPFMSAALWQRFAQPYFTPGQCYAPSQHPGRAGQFPLALPDKELVICSGPQFAGNFWCKNTLDELQAERQHYVGVAAADTLHALSGKPLGFDAPADVQDSYRRGGLPGLPARVYWESTSLRCGAELQAREGVDVAALERIWRTGK